MVDWDSSLFPLGAPSALGGWSDPVWLSVCTSNPQSGVALPRAKKPKGGAAPHYMVVVARRLIVALLLVVGLRTFSSAFLPKTKSALSTAIASTGTTRGRSTLIAMTDVKERAKAAIVGAFVADAATMPLHWIYDADKIKQLLSEAEAEPEFFNPPSCPFYTYSLGAFSPYGDELLPLLRSVAKEGSFDKDAFASESYNFLKAYKGRLNHVSKLYVEGHDGGKPLSECAVDDSQAHGIIKVPILVARYAGQPELLAKVEEAVRVHQNNDASVAASLTVAKVLEKVVLGSSVKDAVESVQAQGGLGEREAMYLQQAREAAWPSASVIKDFGMSCALPGCLLGACYTAYHAGQYKEAIRSSITAAGDQCSRNVVIGALLAAEHGLSAVPESWRSSTSGYSEVAELADEIVSKL